MTRRGRFAPSPTGPLHFGSLVAAIASWLDARASGAEWLVRMEDVDTPRCVRGADMQILRTLASYGLAWDGEVAFQSRRRDLYAAALQRLRDAGLTYRCGCSRREIADSGLRGLEGAIYPGTCRERGLVGGGLAERFRVPPGEVAFVDRAAGELRQDVAREIGDFVLARRDGLHAYQLAVVVDDADQGITDVVRGADLVWSTPRQVLLQQALGFVRPTYLHIPVATNARGEKLSKQTAARAIEEGDVEVARAALRFLGQPVPAGGDPRQVLEGAIAAWDPSRMPPAI